jgi:oxalyl-CoA decarboxylase
MIKPGQIEPRSAWLDQLAKVRQRNQEKMAGRLAANPDPMEFYSALAAIKGVLAGKDVYLVNEGANTLDITRNVIDMRLPRRRLDTGTWGVMGIGMGYAIAAAVVSGKPVVAIEGDSAFGFSGMEIETICRYGLPIVTLVFNNGGIYRGDDVNRSGSPDPAPTTLTKDSRYDRMIEAFGGIGYHAANPKDLAKALTDALAAGKPALINCAIDPKAGTESGHIGNLNPKSNIGQKKEAEGTKRPSPAGVPVTA